MEFVPSIGLAETRTVFHVRLKAAQILVQPKDSLPFSKTTHYNANKSCSLPYVQY